MAELCPGPGMPAEVLSAELLKALEDSWAGPAGSPQRLGVTLSGGPDSAVLAVHAAALAARHALEIHFLHVHHGLQQEADLWQDKVHDLARRLGQPCHSRRIAVRGVRRDGMEAAARRGRYEALEAMAQDLGLDHVLLAHHRGDQAETVLLRLLRGAGPAGLAAMEAVSRKGPLILVRPWLQMDRALILECARLMEEKTGWQPVSDPTNVDDQYTRGAVRLRLAPQLDERWPAWEEILVRHARQSAELREVLDEVAAGDLARLDIASDGRSFSLAAWRALSPPRQALVLRHWLAQHRLRAPSEAKLRDLMRQLRELHALGHDRQMRVKHGDVWIRCIRGRVRVDPAGTGAQDGGKDPQTQRS